MIVPIGSINSDNINNLAAGAAAGISTQINARTSAGAPPTTGRPGEPSATGGSNPLDLSVSRASFEQSQMANRKGGLQAIAGSGESSKIIDAITSRMKIIRGARMDIMG